MPYTFSSILVSLFITIIVYCIFPLLFAAVRRKEISKKKYTITCFIVNLLIHILLFSSVSNSSAYPCFLWTFVFTAIGRKILSNKARLVDPKETTAPESSCAENTIVMAGRNVEHPQHLEIDSRSRGAVQRIKPSITAISAFAFAIALLVVCATQFVQHQHEIEQLNTLISELEAAQTSQEQTIEQLREQISDKEAEIRLLNQAKLRMSDKISELESEIDFYDRYVVFVRDDNTDWYHKYDCMIFQNGHTSFWAYNIDAAISEGFEPCFYCID